MHLFTQNVYLAFQKLQPRIPSAHEGLPFGVSGDVLIKTDV